MLQAETLQQWAEQALAASGALPDAQQSADAEHSVRQGALGLLRRSVEEFRLVPDRSAGGMRADAAVNCGNALSSYAELAGGAEARDALDRAAACYREALSKEEDAAVRASVVSWLLVVYW